ncbi:MULTISPECIES: hypothetical protein [unclassified Amycolatopsis]|uniref:hypothetical protein n=1 Tax=unclassified Amycolatopsis TaxID=2618356 RepID=UPI001C698B96|nr:hypothetical protein [Amycolatopsis sp. DSM 110486]QYN19116.1 hypothetical protein K1T34_41695 [Amycolatopsis sp. DSM 110486]
MSAAGRRAAAGVAKAPAEDDASALLAPLGEARRHHLAADHADLAARVGELGEETGRVREEAISDRRRRTHG